MDHFETIRTVIADALYVEKDDVNRDTNLIRDLGAESIDFLDIMFRLEKEFGIKIPRGEIERRTRGDMSDEEFAENGCLTPKALARLKDVMPEVSSDALVPGLMVRDIPRLMTAASFERIVLEQLENAMVRPISAPRAAERTMHASP